ncbi:hypothetical protein [Nostoc sp.]|uniref:hypothetical protein n=1 Tax=Nostoc sp. TaxID=1180 RepID=UPI002FFCAB3E
MSQSCVTHSVRAASRREALASHRSPSVSQRASQPAFDITDDKWLRVCALFVYIWFAIALTGYHKRKVMTFVSHWRHWI